MEPQTRGGVVVESLSRPDQVLVGCVVIAVGLLVMLSLRGTRPGAPARMGAIVAGIVMLLALMVGLRANDLTKSRSDDRPAPAALRPTAALPFGDATVSGDPQSGLNVRAPGSAATTGGAYLSDARFCDGRLDAVVRIDRATARSSPDATNPVATIDTAPSGLVLGVRVESDPAVPAGLSVEYVPADQQVRLTSANGTTLGTLTSAATEPTIRVDLHGTAARVWFDGQPLTARPVPVTDGCGAVRFSAWGDGAVLRNVVISPAS